MKLTIYQVDAFTDRVFGGNPAAVIPLESWLSEEILQNIALENNLSETAFYIPMGDHFGLRWFTPACEVDLCGHATLATAHVLFHHLDYLQPEITFQTKSGPLTVAKHPSGYIMNFPADVLEPAHQFDEIEKSIGIRPLQVFKGKDDLMAVVGQQKQIEALQPNFDLISKYFSSRGLIVTAPGDQVDFVSRCFFPNAGINEDPVTGSAHTTMAPYWSKTLQKKHLSAIQLSKRQGHIRCIDHGERIELIGQARTYLQGSIQF